MGILIVGFVIDLASGLAFEVKNFIDRSILQNAFLRKE